MNPKNKTQKEVQRTFIIGDPWLYFKFYTGPKTADVALTEMIKPVTEKLLSQKIIDLWFFIRYSDPKLHIRVRFHFNDPRFIANIVREINSYSKPFIKENLIWKVQTDTYQREIERYGSPTMELSEQLFFHDSNMIVQMLDLIEGDEGEQIRWMFSLRAIDGMLDDFKFNMTQKLDLVTVLRDGFGQEFGSNRNMRKQLEQKYRKNRPEINFILDHFNDQTSEIKPLLDLISQKSTAIQGITTDILALTQGEQSEKQLNDLMGSYLHMMVNRLFKTKQRLHEMVLYDFLCRYYKSEIAKKKYIKNP